MVRILISAVAMISLLSGCSSTRLHKTSYTDAGTDWDDGSTNPTRFAVVAGYTSSPARIKAVRVELAAGDHIGDAVATEWNRGPLEVPAFQCGADRSIVKFPDNVTDLWVIDRNLNAHRITDTPVTLPDGLKVRKHTEPCP